MLQYSWLMDYEKEAYLYLLFPHTGNKDFQESTPKIQMLMFGLAQTSHFGLARKELKVDPSQY